MLLLMMQLGLGKDQAAGKSRFYSLARASMHLFPSSVSGKAHALAAGQRRFQVRCATEEPEGVSNACSAERG